MSICRNTVVENDEFVFIRCVCIVVVVVVDDDVVVVVVVVVGLYILSTCRKYISMSIVSSCA